MNATPTLRPIQWRGDAASGTVEMLDQRALPGRELWLAYDTAEGVADAIRSMVIRGAPAIGIAAAMGVVLGLRPHEHASASAFAARLDEVTALLAATRPTAVNLFWALERMRTLAQGPLAPAERLPRLHAEALAILAEDEAMNRAMGQHGAALMPRGARILTHCNAGALATGGYGTALGVIRACHERAQAEGSAPIHVWVDETRPYLQGARLTAWEMVKEGIAATLISDNMAAFFMQRGEVDAVIIGADRIARNGDVANKIGSYGLAVLAHHHGIPFYVAAPSSTLDPATPSGAEIVIEERSARELVQIGNTLVAPEGIAVRHPAFDVSPNALVSAIITERGVFRAPYDFAR